MLCYAKLYSMNHKFTSEGARKRKLVLHIEEIYLKFCVDRTINDLIVSIIKSAVCILNVCFKQGGSAAQAPPLCQHCCGHCCVSLYH